MNRHAMQGTKKLTLLLTGLVFVTFCHAASRAEQESACKGDALHYCTAEIPDKDKIAACLKQHYAQLKPACRAMFSAPSQGGGTSH